nr:MAG TPA: hypothetical protein [Caudoviricetes sp.]
MSIYHGAFLEEGISVLVDISTRQASLSALSNREGTVLRIPILWLVFFV